MLCILYNILYVLCLILGKSPIISKRQLGMKPVSLYDFYIAVFIVGCGIETWPTMYTGVNLIGGRKNYLNNILTSS